MPVQAGKKRVVQEGCAAEREGSSDPPGACSSTVQPKTEVIPGR